MLQIPLRDGGDVLSAKHADFEALVGARRELGAGGFEVGQGLVDDVVGIDVGGDGLAGAFVRDQLARGGEVDAVDVWVSGEGSVVFLWDRRWDGIRMEGLRDGGGAAGEVDFLGAGFAGHAADLETVWARI